MDTGERGGVLARLEQSGENDNSFSSGSRTAPKNTTKPSLTFVKRSSGFCLWLSLHVCGDLRQPRVCAVCD